MEFEKPLRKYTPEDEEYMEKIQRSSPSYSLPSKEIVDQMLNKPPLYMLSTGSEGLKEYRRIFEDLLKEMKMDSVMDDRVVAASLVITTTENEKKKSEPKKPVRKNINLKNQDKNQWKHRLRYS